MRRLFGFWVLGCLSVFPGDDTGYARGMKTLFLCAILVAPSLYAGDLLLQFDDGFENWIEVIAPELKRAGGTATGYVNNQSLESGRISEDSLKKLRDEFGWEIGTHTYHHLDAVDYVAVHSLEQWLEKELSASLEDFKKRGFAIRSLAYPFNSQDASLCKAAAPFVTTYRRRDKLGIFTRFGQDGSFPAASIDIAHYTPINTILKRLELAVESEQSISLYAHRVLPDTLFAEARIESVQGGQLILDKEIHLDPKESLILIPDIAKATISPAPFNIARIEGNTLTLAFDGEAPQLKAGATALIGPSYSTRLSDFRAILDAAKGKLSIKTVSQAHDDSR
jgi:peptidoglycan/xylan/chitin deacetylase (PgdA/CDA1 family)